MEIFKTLCDLRGIFLSRTTKNVYIYALYFSSLILFNFSPLISRTNLYEQEREKESKRRNLTNLLFRNLSSKFND